MAAIIGGGIAAVGAIGSAAISSSASGDAASQQQAGASSASATQLAMFNQIQQNLKPYMDTGSSAISDLGNLTGTNSGGNPLTAPLTRQFQPTMAQLAETPGYQFSLQQGQQATQNSYAAQGLGSSGAALKGAANYAEGLAGTTYQQQFNNFQSANQQTYNMLSGLSGLGENAAAGVGNAGISTGNSIASNTIGAANAGAAGTVGSANALSGGLGSISNLGALASLGGLFSGGNPGFSTPTSASTVSASPDFINSLLNFGGPQ